MITGAAFLLITDDVSRNLLAVEIPIGILTAFIGAPFFIYLILKLLFWDNFPAGMAPLLIVTCLLGSIQLFFIGFLGEYVLSINKRMMKRPLVIEEERLNFDRTEEK